MKKRTELIIKREIIIGYNNVFNIDCTNSQSENHRWVRKSVKLVLLSVSTRNKTLFSVNLLIKCIKGYYISNKNKTKKNKQTNRKQKNFYQAVTNNTIQ